MRSFTEATAREDFTGTPSYPQVAAAPFPRSAQIIKFDQPWAFKGPTEKNDQKVAPVVSQPANTQLLGDRYLELVAKMNAFAVRSENWDGDGGRAPEHKTMVEALAFLEFLNAANFLPHDIYSPGDGEINFEWRANKRFTEVGFNGDATISWFHRDAEREILRDDSFSAENVSEHVELLEILGI